MKTLVAYFSATGTTESVARKLADAKEIKQWIEEVEK